MTTLRGRRALPLFALVTSFCTGVLVDGWLRTHGPPQPWQAGTKTAERVLEAVAASSPAASVERRRAVPPADVPRMVAAPVEQTPLAAIAAPSAAGLRMPIDGITVESFKTGFAEHRGSLPHEAVDIVAPRGTPIHAVQDGTIAKLFLSKAGGNTIYEFDVGGRLSYYYAHLDSYAEGLHDGQPVSRGEVIGYVGTTGNAPPDTPHLHFGVFELTADRKWWQGRPLDPYLVFKDKG